MTTTLKLEQLYLNGDKTKPTIQAAVDARGRLFHYNAHDGTVAIGKLHARDTGSAEATTALVERCRERSGVASIGWYVVGSDVIEIAAADVEHVDRVCAAFKKEGYPISMHTYH